MKLRVRSDGLLHGPGGLRDELLGQALCGWAWDVGASQPHSSLADVKPILAGRNRGRGGRPAAVTTELAHEVVARVAAGTPLVRALEEVGVDQRSWYRYATAMALLRRPWKRKPPRHYKALPDRVVGEVVRLDKDGVPRARIAERLGLHPNTVSKLLLRAGRPRLTAGGAGRPAEVWRRERLGLDAREPSSEGV